MSRCRLCQGATREVWRHLVLGKYDAGYFECADCGSLQTETPYWLDEAYSIGGAGFDTGACQRSIDSALAMSALLEGLGFRKDRECLDFGAGIGLYARMMRDRGWNYFAYETYNAPYYMDKFTAEPGSRTWGLVSAFEVFEHLPDPAQTLDLILGAAEDYVFFSTELFEGQGRDWHYPNPAEGQHVFFYSRKALESVARGHGFEFHDLGFFKCFLRPSLKERLALIKPQDFGRQVMEALLRHQRDPYRYAARDHAQLLNAGPVAGVTRPRS